MRSTRPKDPSAPTFVRELVDWGAGPRAGQFLIQGGKALAAMEARFSVAIDDIKRLAVPVLRHRIATNFQAQARRHRPPTDQSAADAGNPEVRSVSPARKSLSQRRKDAKDAQIQTYLFCFACSSLRLSAFVRDLLLPLHFKRFFDLERNCRAC